MDSLRIKTIASLVNKDAYLVDIGTDHAYLPIYLYKNNITKNIIASDISENVLNASLNNLKKYDLDKKIELVQSDGFSNISNKIDTAVIAGMGTSTIIKIINNCSVLPNTLIVSPHNNHYELRSFMQNIGYKISKEIALKENDIYYVIIKYIKGKDYLKEDELLFGLSHNKDYYTYLFNHYSNLYELSNSELYKKYTKILERLLKES